MRLILEFNEFMDRESKTRTKGLNEEEFLSIFRENCKNFSFDNDQLWRKSGNFGPFGFFYSQERKTTIGNYDYKDFFDQRKDYPVPRYKSLIGSTTKEGSEYFGMFDKLYRVIPFDGANIVFCCTSDLALLSKVGQKGDFHDWMFILKQYESGFRVPREELFSIMSRTKMSSFYDMVVKKNLGFEFFTNANCLMIEEEKIEWLKSNI